MPAKQPENSEKRANNRPVRADRICGAVRARARSLPAMRADVGTAQTRRAPGRTPTRRNPLWKHPRSRHLSRSLPASPRASPPRSRQPWHPPFQPAAPSSECQCRPPAPLVQTLPGPLTVEATKRLPAPGALRARPGDPCRERHLPGHQSGQKPLNRPLASSVYRTVC
jgi:hypothetical protein